MRTVEEVLSSIGDAEAKAHLYIALETRLRDKQGKLYDKLHNLRYEFLSAKSGLPFYPSCQLTPTVAFKDAMLSQIAQFTDTRYAEGRRFLYHASVLYLGSYYGDDEANVLISEYGGSCASLPVEIIIEMRRAYLAQELEAEE